MADSGSYGQILRSSALIGGSSVINVGVSVIRAKAMALLLGPAGVGLLGLYYSVFDLAISLSGMGINSSGVRQIAEAAGSGDALRIARTAVVLRRTALFLGLAGGLALIAFRRPISMWTFGSDEFELPIALLSVAVFVRAIADGQKALIQGMRRIGDLARIEIIAAVAGTVASVGLVYFLRERGVVPSLVIGTMIGLAAAWWYRRRIQVEPVRVTIPQVRQEAAALLTLGFAFMATAVLTAGGAYAIRTFLASGVGLEAAGFYQAAWALGGMYVGFILQAMGSDFYPRLTAIAHDHDACNRLVNEQAHVSLLLAGPGVLATLTFAPLVIAVFYADSFAAAVGPLRWICLGMALRVIAWPMGYIVLAKGARGVFFCAEIAATIVHVGLAFLLGRWFGLAGATMAFFGLYVWHGLLIYAIVRRLTGFTWSTDNRRIGLLFLTSIVLVFSSFHVLPPWIAMAFGSMAALASAIYSLRLLCRLVSLERAPAFVRSLLVRTRLAPSTTLASA